MILNGPISCSNCHSESTRVNRPLTGLRCSHVGERELEPNPSDTYRNAVPIMKGLMSPAVLVHRHHLTIEQVAHLYDALYMFSMAFHTVIHRIVQRAAHSSELKESIWRVFAELWQAALGLQFPADVLKVLRERDAALAAVTQKAQVDTGNNDEVEQRCEIVHACTHFCDVMLCIHAVPDCARAVCKASLTGARRCWAQPCSRSAQSKT